MNKTINQIEICHLPLAIFEANIQIQPEKNRVISAQSYYLISSLSYRVLNCYKIPIYPADSTISVSFSTNFFLIVRRTHSLQSQILFQTELHFFC